MWDSAVDYCHYYGKVFNAEADYILYKLFSTTLLASLNTPSTSSSSSNTKILYFERHFLKDYKLFRFSSDTTVYISKGNQ